MREPLHYDWRADVRARLANLSLVPEDEARIVDEVAQHLEEQFAELCASIDPAAAREQLLAQLRDEHFDRIATGRRRITRRSRLGAKLDAMGGIWRDAAHALRSLSRSPGVAIPGVVALALGIGLTTAMFSILYGTLLKGLPFHDGDRIAAVAQTDPALPGDQQDAMSYEDFDAYRLRQHALQSFGAYRMGNANVSGGDRPERIGVARVTAEAIDVTGVRPMLGRSLVPADNTFGAPLVAVLGYAMWRDRFASDSSALGKTLRVNERTYTIVGVMPEGFVFPGVVQVWLPLQVDRATMQGGGPTVTAVGLVRSGLSYAGANAEFAVLAKTIQAERDPAAAKLIPRIQPFIRNSIRPQVYTLMYAMLGAVGLVLIVACANVANLLLHRAADRMKEIGIRAALGASRAAIVRRALVESLLLAGLAAILGIGIARGFMAWFTRRLPVNEGLFWMDIRLHVPVLVFTIAIAIAAGVIAGVLPAIQSARIDVGAILKDDVYGISALRIGRLSRSVIVVEIAVASAMLVAAGFITKSIIRLKNVDPGFRTAGVLTAQITLSTTDSARRRRFFSDLETKLTSTPGVDAVYLGSGVPGMGWGVTRLSVDGRTYARDRDRPSARTLAVSAGFFDMFGVKVVRGRRITAGDRAGATPVAVVSESFVRRNVRDGDPIGQRIRFESGTPGEWLTIVGVTPALYAAGPQNDPWPAEVLTSLPQEGARGSAAVALTGSGDLGAVLRATVSSLDPDAPLYGVTMLDVALAKAQWPMQVFGGSFVMFGISALVLAAIGLYAVMAFSVSRRVRELGIRLALGATAGDVVRMIVRQASVTIGIGMSIGLVLGALAAQGLRAVLFDVSSTDPMVFAVVGGVLAAVAIAACLVPTIRATKADPVAALRSQ